MKEVNYFDVSEIPGADFDLHRNFLSALYEQIVEDDRIRAAWLEGSFGRGNADCYSDIDLHLWLSDEGVASLRGEAEAWLNRLAPVVLFRLMFDGRMINALTVDGLRLDIWLHEGEAPQLRPGAARVLYDPGEALYTAAPQERDPQALAATLESQIKEFWRCIALTPSVLGRRERIVGLMGLSIESTLIGELCIAGYGIQRDSGVKRLNDYLPAHIREQIEAALSFDGCNEAALAQAQLALARIVQKEGPKLAADHGFAYPQALEDAVMAYVSQEMDRLQL